jgi:hypothetical protein
MNNTTQNIIEESIKRFEARWKRMIGGGMGKRADMNGRWTWTLGDDEDDEAYVDESLRSFLSSELSTAISTAIEGVVEEIKKSRKLINTFHAEMTVNTTDGSKGEVFMALPELMTNQIIDMLLSTLKGNHEE